MKASELPAFDHHEDVQLFDLGQGARAIIAIHSTFRGPALGGCRLWHYPSLEAAMTDALRLSRGMSYKNAMADVPLGGGKAVIMLPDGDFDRVALFKAFGRAVESLGGRYITGEDVGCTVADMEVVHTQTAYVHGLTAQPGKAGGNPSPWTGLGVFAALKAALEWKLGKGLQGARVSIQGAGAVGADLARRLVEAGAVVTLADINAERVRELAGKLGVAVVAPDQIHKVKADVFAPCALGGSLNDKTITELGAPIVCGSANNQLATPEIGVKLHKRGVLFCPDYVVNAGGVILIDGEGRGESLADAKHDIERIAVRLLDILARAKDQNLPPEAMADTIALERMGRPPQANAA